MKEILIALTALVNLIRAVLSFWQEYKHRRMERIDKGD